MRAATRGRVSRFIYFLDRSLGKKVVAQELRNAGLQVELHDNHFPPSASDEEWLREVGSRGWIVLTKDQMIRYRATEIAAVVRAGVRAFVLVGGNLTGMEIAFSFLTALPEMERLAESQPPPFIARVTRGGSVSLLVAAHEAP